MIPIKKIIADGVVVIFDQLQELVEQTTFTKPGSGSYDVTLGRVVGGLDEVITAGCLFFDEDFRDSRTADNLDSPASSFAIGDKLLITKAVNYLNVVEPSASFFPSENISLEHSGVPWRIVNTSLDPTGTLYTIHIRRAT